jgi:hypothetical protein
MVTRCAVGSASVSGGGSDGGVATLAPPKARPKAFPKPAPISSFAPPEIPVPADTAPYKPVYRPLDPRDEELTPIGRLNLPDVVKAETAWEPGMALGIASIFERHGIVCPETSKQLEHYARNPGAIQSYISRQKLKDKEQERKERVLLETLEDRLAARMANNQELQTKHMAAGFVTGYTIGRCLRWLWDGKDVGPRKTSVGPASSQSAKQPRVVKFPNGDTVVIPDNAPKEYEHYILQLQRQLTLDVLRESHPALRRM